MTHTTIKEKTLKYNLLFLTKILTFNNISVTIYKVSVLTIRRENK